MGVASLILGVVGLLAMAVGGSMPIVWVFYGGAGCSVGALLLGLIGGRKALAGMILGLLGVLFLGSLYVLYLRARSSAMSAREAMTVAPPEPTPARAP